MEEYANHFHKKFRVMENIHLQQLFDLKVLLQPQGLLLQHQHPRPLVVKPTVQYTYMQKTNFTTINGIGDLEYIPSMSKYRASS